jgi:hypothetical protein
MESSLNTKNRSWTVAAAVALATLGCGGVLPSVAEPPLSTADLAARATESCSGVPEQLQKSGLLAFRDSFSETRTLKEVHSNWQKSRGAVIALRATPGVSVPWLGRVNSCHIAMVAAGRVGQGADDPFTVPGAATVIRETYDGFELVIRVATGDESDEVARRARIALSGKEKDLALAHVTTR